MIGTNLVLQDKHPATPASNLGMTNPYYEALKKIQAERDGVITSMRQILSDFISNQKKSPFTSISFNAMLQLGYRDTDTTSRIVGEKPGIITFPIDKSDLIQFKNWLNFNYGYRCSAQRR